ncbi:MAG: hypothetical protein CMF73_13000 [Maricaulis sp.]|nr:hypothetical protein [Maricaulis sp.]
MCICNVNTSICGDHAHTRAMQAKTLMPAGGPYPERDLRLAVRPARLFDRRRHLAITHAIFPGPRPGTDRARLEALSLRLAPDSADALSGKMVMEFRECGSLCAPGLGN